MPIPPHAWVACANCDKLVKASRAIFVSVFGGKLGFCCRSCEREWLQISEFEAAAGLLASMREN